MFKLWLIELFWIEVVWTVTNKCLKCTHWVISESSSGSTLIDGLRSEKSNSFSIGRWSWRKISSRCNAYPLRRFSALAKDVEAHGFYNCWSRWTSWWPNRWRARPSSCLILRNTGPISALLYKTLLLPACWASFRLRSTVLPLTTYNFTNLLVKARMWYVYSH